MSAIEQQDSHRRHRNGGMAKEEFIRVETYALQDCGATETERGYVKKHRNGTTRPSTGLRQGLHRQRSQYDGFCTVPEHIGYRSVVGSS